MNTKDFDKTENNFYFDRDTTFIHNQSITVHGDLHFGGARRTKMGVEEQAAEMEEMAEAQLCEDVPAKQCDDELEGVLRSGTPFDWCMAGIRNVVKAGHIEMEYDWAAVYHIILERTIYNRLSPTDFEKMFAQSGASLDDDRRPVANNYRKVHIEGRYPEWCIKGYDATNRFLQIAKDFLYGYVEAKNRG